MRNDELFRTIANLFSESRGTKPFEKYGNEVSFHDVKPAGSDNKYIRYETVKHTVKDFFFLYNAFLPKLLFHTAKQNLNISDTT